MINKSFAGNLQNIAQKKYNLDVSYTDFTDTNTQQTRIKNMIIPHQELSTDALHALIEEFVTRSGTDYGVSEASLDEKVQQVQRQLEKGEVVIVYDAAMESCNITSALQARMNFPSDPE